MPESRKHKYIFNYHFVPPWRWIILLLFTISIQPIFATSPKDSLVQVWEDSSLPDSTRLKTMNHLIQKYFARIYPDSTKKYADKLYDFSVKTKDKYFQAQAQYYLGNAAILSGEYNQASIYHHQALEIWKSLDKNKSLIGSYNSLGLIHLNLGEFDQARDFLESAIQTAYALGDSSKSLSALSNLASIYETEGDIMTSFNYNRQVLALAKRYNKEYNISLAHNNLANNYKTFGDLPNATHHYLQARAIYEKSNDPSGVNSTLNNLALLYMIHEEYQKAEEYLNESLKIISGQNLVPDEAKTILNLALLYRRQKKVDKSLSFNQKALSFVIEKDLSYLKPFARLEIGNILLEMGKFKEAEMYFRQGLEDCKVNGSNKDFLSAYSSLSELYLAQNNWDEAKRYAEEGYALADKNDQFGSKSRFAGTLVKIYKHFGDTENALRMNEVILSVRDSIYNQENVRELIKQEYKYSYEKKAFQDSLRNEATLQLQEADLKRRNLTIWFLGGFLALVVLFGLIIFNRLRLIGKQKKMIEQANEQLKELDNFKSLFFTNISHEFRTPLTVIGGMIDQIYTQPDRWLEKGSKLIKRNVSNLLNLINQILDLRKLESGNLKLALIQDDIIAFISYGTQSFESLAASKSVNLEFHSDLVSQTMDFDPEKLLQIQTNLVSNAIKFTPSEGKVEVKVSKSSENTLQFQVKDTGIGIPTEKLPLIFDRFYQVDQTDTREGEGTGIGLSLTKELVQLMNGKIEVESEPAKGTVFTVFLPITQNAPIQSATSQQSAKEVLPISPIPIPEVPISRPLTIIEERPSLLIIEDNPDIVTYLYSCLEDQYELFSAPDGQEGIEAALEHIPDLIITDVMMPHKNGYEVCETLKLDERTSHIPIVMLTAKADQPSRLEGYKRGADAYLAKPFDQEELLIRLQKLLEIRRTLQLRYQSGELPPKTDDPIIQVEDAFLAKAREFILANLDDSTYRGESLCRDLGMSRANLHRKIKALTDMSTSHFIRSVKIDHAKGLLKDPQLQVAEIGYMVGFSTSNYFHRIFHEVTGMSPGEYRSKNEK